MTKIAKNTTISPITLGDVGVTVPTSGQYVIPPQDYLLWAASEDVIPLISSGDIVINDGVKDLSVKLGLAYVLDLEQRPKNVLRVSKDSAQNADFSTIKDALDSILDSDPRVIIVSPGTYVEDNTAVPISLNENVTIKTEGHGTVTVTPSNPNVNLFEVSGSGRRLQGIAISGVTGAAAIKITAASLPVVLDFITISNCKEYIIVESSTAVTQAVLRNIRLISGSTTTNLLKITSSGGFSSIARIYSAILTDDDGTVFENGVLLSGPNVRLDPNTLLMRSTTGVGNGITLRDGAYLVGQSGFEIDGFNKNLVTENVGSAPVILVASSVLSNGVTADLQIDHPSTSGDIWGIFRLSKVFNAAPNTLTMGFQDPITGDINCTRILATRGFATDLTTISTTGTTTQIDAQDAHVYVTTGTTSGEILQLPDATTLREGHQYWIINESSQLVTIRQFGGSNPILVSPKSSINYVLRSNSTSAGVWSRSATLSSLFSGSSTLLAFYNANANVGRYLEIFPASASNESPILIPNNSLLVAITLGATALSTGTIGVFKTTDLVTPITTISLNNQDSVKNTALAILLSADDKLALRVTSGSISKPRVAMYLVGA